MATRRRAAATPDYWWFSGESVQRLTEKLTVTASPRLEVRLENNKMTFVVVDGSTGTAHDPINDSHPCPPFCP